MTVLTRDDLLGRPTGPMLPLDEGAMRGRESETLIPPGDVQDVREFPPGGALVSRKNAYLTGRVKVLTTGNQERNFPRDGGESFDEQRENKMSYRTRAETFRFDPYGQDRAVVGPPGWPSKRLFPYNPSIQQVTDIEHDILPPATVTSSEDSTVVPVPGDDSRRGFVPAEDLERGGVGMLYGMGEEFYRYGGPELDTESGLDEQEILTLVAWDEQKHDWQLGDMLAAKVSGFASKLAAKIAKAALAKAKAGEFKSEADAEKWIRDRAEKIRVRRVKKIESAIKVAVEQAIKMLRPKLKQLLSGQAVGDYLMNDDAMGEFQWGGRGFAWGRRGRLVGASPSRLRALTAEAARRVEIKRERKKLKGGARILPATPPRLADDEMLPEYADAEDTSGWRGFTDTDRFSYIPGLGQLPGAVTYDALTKSGTEAVTQAVKSGEISTVDQIMSAISTAAKTGAEVYSKVAVAEAQQAAIKASAVKPLVPISPTVATALAPLDVPIWKSPLFWVGAGLLVLGGGYMVLRGGGSGTRRRARRNRRWKSRWA